MTCFLLVAFLAISTDLFGDGLDDYRGHADFVDDAFGDGVLVIVSRRSGILTRNDFLLSPTNSDGACLLACLCFSGRWADVFFNLHHPLTRKGNYDAKA